MTEPTHVCNQCHTEKPTSEYYKSKHHPNGHVPTCKDCFRERANSYYRKKHPKHPRQIAEWKNGQCKQCLQPFTRQKRTTQFCSVKCRYAYEKEHAKPKQLTPGQLAQTEMRECECCGNIFAAVLKQDKTCSQKCSAERERMRNVDHTHRRRARQRIGGYINKLQIFRRDKWVCGICGETINPDANYPSMESASLDHIVPLSRGGVHALENVQAAHLRCNLAKGAKTVSEHRVV